jgi:tol-pal system protein YbgF
MQAEAARTDSVRAAVLDQLIGMQQQSLDSLAVLRRGLVAFEAYVRTDMTDVQRQLVQIQELTGQSQQRLTELRGQVDARLRQPMPTYVAGGDTTGAAAVGDIDPQELYDLSLQQLRRGSPVTARTGFQQFLTTFPRHPLAPDARYFLGESWDESEPDSAAAEYELVARDFPDSRRAPTAIYRLGLIAERRGDRRAAEVYYTRVVAGWPRSEEAQLARSKLGNPDS